MIAAPYFPNSSTRSSSSRAGTPFTGACDDNKDARRSTFTLPPNSTLTDFAELQAAGKYSPIRDLRFRRDMNNSAPWSPLAFTPVSTTSASSSGQQTPLYAGLGLSYAPPNPPVPSGVPGYDSFSDSDGPSRSSTPSLPSPFVRNARSPPPSRPAFVFGSKKPKPNQSFEDAYEDIKSQSVGDYSRLALIAASCQPDQTRQPKRQYKKKIPPGACAACGATETPEWRKGPTGARTLCNACGLQWLKNFSEREDIDDADYALAALRDLRRSKKPNVSDGPSLTVKSAELQKFMNPSKAGQSLTTKQSSRSNMAAAAARLQSLGNSAYSQPIPVPTSGASSLFPTPFGYDQPSTFSGPSTSTAISGPSGSTARSGASYPYQAGANLFGPSFSAPEQYQYSSAIIPGRSRRIDASAPSEFGPNAAGNDDMQYRMFGSNPFGR